jgi:alpha-mannosidase
MIEDKSSGQKMIVMNDRSEGGSAFHKGRIELMINRRGITRDALGNDEFMIETSNGKGILVFAKYYLQFSDNREESFNSI